MPLVKQLSDEPEFHFVKDQVNQNSAVGVSMERKWIFRLLAYVK